MTSFATSLAATDSAYQYSHPPPDAALHHMWYVDRFGAVWYNTYLLSNCYQTHVGDAYEASTWRILHTICANIEGLTSMLVMRAR